MFIVPLELSVRIWRIGLILDDINYPCDVERFVHLGLLPQFLDPVIVRFHFPKGVEKLFLATRRDGQDKKRGNQDCRFKLALFASSLLSLPQGRKSRKDLASKLIKMLHIS